LPLLLPLLLRLLLLRLLPLLLPLPLLMLMPMPLPSCWHPLYVRRRLPFRLLLLRQRYPLRRHHGVVALSRNPSQAAEPTQAQRRCAIHDQQAAQAVSAQGSSGRTATYIPSPHLSCGSFPKWAGNCSGM
jgi:hypothetical protein